MGKFESESSEEPKAFVVKKNPLTTLWNWLGTVGGVISLSSMAEEWASGFFKWGGFINSVIEAYRSVIEPIFSFFPISQWLGDYLVIGLLFSVSLLKGFGGSLVYYHMERHNEDCGLEPNWEDMFAWASLVTFCWPVLVLYASYSSLILLFESKATAIVKNSKGCPVNKLSDVNLYEVWRAVLLWFGAVLLGTTILLSINAVFYF